MMAEPAEPALTPYERKRMENIHRNNAQMQKMLGGVWVLQPPCLEHM